MATTWGKSRVVGKTKYAYRINVPYQCMDRREVMNVTRRRCFRGCCGRR